MASLKNAPNFDAGTLLMQMCGVDLTRIDGIDVTTAFKVLTHHHYRCQHETRYRRGYYPFYASKK